MDPNHNQPGANKKASNARSTPRSPKYSWRHAPRRNVEPADSSDIFTSTPSEPDNSSDASFRTAESHFSTAESADSDPLAASSTNSYILPSQSSLRSEREVFDFNLNELEQYCTILQTSKGDLKWPGKLTNSQIAIAHARIAELEAEEQGKRLDRFDINEAIKRRKADREAEYSGEDARELLERQRRKLEKELKEAMKDA